MSKDNNSWDEVFGIEQISEKDGSVRKMPRMSAGGGPSAAVLLAAANIEALVH